MFNWSIYFFVSGIAFYVGAGMVIIACWACLSSKGKLAKRTFPFILAVAILLMIFSATPISIWYYIIALIGFVIFAVLKFRKSEFAVLFYTFVLLWSLGGLGWELQYFRAPEISGSYDKIYVIGDSVSDGIGQEAKPWPALLKGNSKIDIVNLAASGATAETALKQACQIKPGPAIVIIEIGGNDLLGDTTNKQFEKDLDKLLAELNKKDKKLVMFELPLLPNKVGYGKIQRRLAKKYDVELIPKRLFAAIITCPGKTVDNIHLSDKGHQHMADTVGKILKGVTGS